MPVKKRQNLAGTGRGSYYKEEWLEEFLDSKGVLVIKVNYRRVLPIDAIK